MFPVRLIGGTIAVLMFSLFFFGRVAMSVFLCPAHCHDTLLASPVTLGR